MIDYKKTHINRILDSDYRFSDWHLCINQNCDIEKLKNLVNNCQSTLKFFKENKYEGLVNDIGEGIIKRYELDLYLGKLDYYLNKLKLLKLDIRYHVVDINIKNKDINILREDFMDIYTYVIEKGRITQFYILTHPQYKYIFNGITSDLRRIKDYKQVRYISSYIEMLWITEEVNNLWKLNIDKFKLNSINFNIENVIEELEYQCVQLHKIFNLYLIYTKSISKLLKKNTCFQLLNPYKESTYEKLHQVIDYLNFYNEYLEKKTFQENEKMHCIVI